jgi:hypothetical protein
MLAYCEHTPKGYKLHARRFDAHAKFEGSSVALPGVGGEARRPGLAVDESGAVALVWGINDSNGQQSVRFAQGVPKW